MPSRQLYLATPLTRTVETANAFGDTLGAYRTAFNTVVAARAWSTSVSGPALMTAGGLDADGIHPSNAGHTTLGTAIPTALGV
jgi:lysophospholipase L1-like esterase